MGDWNYNIAEAPKGRYVIKEVQRKGKTIYREEYEHDLIIATDGKIVTLSKWLPPIKKGPEYRQRDGRWSMFGVTETPLAWMPWPKPPFADRYL